MSSGTRDLECRSSVSARDVLGRPPKRMKPPTPSFERFVDAGAGLLEAVVASQRIAG